jgi:ribosomal protein S18 acetylase RimI-like enzyme
MLYSRFKKSKPSTESKFSTLICGEFKTPPLRDLSHRIFIVTVNQNLTPPTLLMSRKVQILPAKPSDSGIIAHILVNSWRTAYQGIMAQDVLANLSVEKRRDVWENHLSCGGEAYLLMLEAQPIGVVEISQFRDVIKDFLGYGEIPVIYLLPEYLNQGLGSALLQFARKRLQAKNLQNIGIWVLEKNVRAIRFYQKHGFEFSGHTKVYGATGLIEQLFVNTIY